MTPAANFATSTAGVVDTGGKFVPDVNHTDGKLQLVTTTPAVNCHQCQPHLHVANNRNDIRLLTPEPYFTHMV
jgi:hypothetical protein